MKLKLDENGHVVVKDGFPVWVAEDGAEIAYNVPDLVNKISAVNGESAARRKDIDALTSQLKAFDGIDPEKAKAALETVANLDAGKLIDAGKVDDLKMEIKKSYDGKISDLEKALADSKKDSADRLAAKEASIRTLLVKGIFDSSAFLKDKTVLPSDVAYASFGRHFEVKEENGELRVVATMNGQPIFSRSDPGTFAAPEEALEAIIDKYPMKDRILKAPDGGSPLQDPAPATRPLRMGRAGIRGRLAHPLFQGDDQGTVGSEPQPHGHHLFLRVQRTLFREGGGRKKLRDWCGRLADNAPSCDECREIWALDGLEPPCGACTSSETELLPDNLQSMHIWQICDIHARDFVGMAGQARPIRLEAVRVECDRTDDPEGNFQKVMLIEAVLFPVRYLKKWH